MFQYEALIGAELKNNGQPQALAEALKFYGESAFTQIYGRLPENHCGDFIENELAQIGVNPNLYRFARAEMSQVGVISLEEQFMRSLYIVASRFRTIRKKRLAVDDQVKIETAPKEAFRITEITDELLVLLDGRVQPAHPLWLSRPLG